MIRSRDGRAFLHSRSRLPEMLIPFPLAGRSNISGSEPNNTKQRRPKRQASIVAGRCRPFTTAGSARADKEEDAALRLPKVAGTQMYKVCGPAQSPRCFESESRCFSSPEPRVTDASKPPPRRALCPKPPQIRQACRICARAFRCC
jgi:hypothetical protein